MAHWSDGNFGRPYSEHQWLENCPDCGCPGDSHSEEYGCLGPDDDTHCPGDGAYLSPGHQCFTLISTIPARKDVDC